MAAFNPSRRGLNFSIAALNCASYCRYAFFPRDIDATITANPAAMAPAAAAALPPPGVAVGAANCSTNGSTAARSPPTDIFPLITAVRRFSKIRDESKFSTCKNHSAACSNAFFGINPTISLETGTTPYRAASRFTISNTLCTGVCSKSVRFIETCAMPRTKNPAPFTNRIPPFENRTAFAIFFAMSTCGVFRNTL